MAERRAGPNGEWLEREGDVVTVGLTRAAKGQLGTIVSVHLPAIGSILQQGEVAVVVESSKAAIDCECPISGTVKTVNFCLLSTPNVVNEAPEYDGWLYRLDHVDEGEWDRLPPLMTNDADSVSAVGLRPVGSLVEP